MSKGAYPLLRPSGQPWTPTVPAIDHPLREVPRWVLNIGTKLMRGQALAPGEEERLNAWCELQGQEREGLWPDDHVIIKRPFVKVQ